MAFWEFLQNLTFIFDGPGMLLIALLDSSFLSIPEGNDLLIVILSIGKSWERVAYYVGMTTVGSIVGCFLLYLVGRKGGSPILRKRFSEKNVGRAERLYEKFGILTLVVPSILPPPCPFKIFVLSAGVFRVSQAKFLAAVAIGRAVRYSMWGVLALLYGEKVKTYMENNLWVLGAVLFGLLVVAIGVLVTLHFAQAQKSSRRSPQN